MVFLITPASTGPLPWMVRMVQTIAGLVPETPAASLTTSTVMMITTTTMITTTGVRAAINQMAVTRSASEARIVRPTIIIVRKVHVTRQRKNAQIIATMKGAVVMLELLAMIAGAILTVVQRMKDAVVAKDVVAMTAMTYRMVARRMKDAVAVLLVIDGSASSPPNCRRCVKPRSMGHVVGWGFDRAGSPTETLRAVALCVRKCSPTQCIAPATPVNTRCPSNSCEHSNGLKGIQLGGGVPTVNTGVSL